MLRVLHHCPKLDQFGLATTWDVYLGENDSQDVAVTKEIGLDRGLSKHVGKTVLDVDQYYTCVVATQHEWQLAEVEARDFLHSPTACLGR